MDISGELALCSNHSRAVCPNQTRHSVMASSYENSTRELDSLDCTQPLSSRQSTPSPSQVRQSPAPVPSHPLSFSISRILGLEDNVTHPRSADSLIPASENSISDHIQENSIDKSRECSDHSPNIDSDNPSTDVDSGRESDAGRSTPSSAERPKKKKQRTTFSPIEVRELEKVFSKRPYLMPEDEDELVQKLGLTTRNIRFWFQNRRAKLRRQERISSSFPHTDLPNQFDQSPPAFYRQLQFGNPMYSVHERFQRPLLFPNHAENRPRNQLAYTPERVPCPCCPVKSNRFPAAEAYSAPHQDYLKYLSNQFADPSPFMQTLPRVRPNLSHAGADHQQRSRDHQTRWVIGIREDEDQY